MTVQPLSYEQAQVAMSQLSRQRRQAEDEYKEALVAAVEAGGNYRLAKAKAYALAATEGGTADQKKIRAEELAADAEHSRDIADALVKAAKERLVGLDGERASLHRLVEWSMALNKQGVL